MSAARAFEAPASIFTPTLNYFMIHVFAFEI